MNECVRLYSNMSLNCFSESQSKHLGIVFDGLSA